MKVKLAIVLALPTLVLGCAGSTSSKQTSSGMYVDRELRTSFRVPSGWAPPSSWGLAKKEHRWAARFEAPGGDAAVTLAQSTYSGINCASAAKAALSAADDASLTPAKEFELKTSSGTMPAGTATTSASGREGMARFFCFGGTAVVVEASAATSAAASRRGDLESVMDSVSYEEGSQQIALRPPPPAAEPTFFEHVVRFRGQTLGQVAEWYTGSYDNWKKLARYNEDTPVPNTVLKTGRSIKIPTELLVRRDPLPQPKRAAKPKSTKTAQQSDTAKEPNVEAAGAEEEVGGVEPKGEAGEGPADLPPVIGPR
jgi:hypothetical protein